MSSEADKVETNEVVTNNVETKEIISEVATTEEINKIDSEVVVTEETNKEIVESDKIVEVNSDTKVSEEKLNECTEKVIEKVSDNDTNINCSETSTIISTSENGHVCSNGHNHINSEDDKLLGKKVARTDDTNDEAEKLDS